MNDILKALFDVIINPGFYNNVIAVTPPILLAALGCSIAAKAQFYSDGYGRNHVAFFIYWNFSRCLYWWTKSLVRSACQLLLVSIGIFSCFL